MIGLGSVLQMRKIILKYHQGQLHLFVASTSGVYECENGYAISPTWSQLVSGNFYDIEFDPQNSGIIYASSTGANSSIYKLDWINNYYTELPNLTSIPQEDGRRLIIETSLAAPQYLFIAATYMNSDNYSYLYRYNLSNNSILYKGEFESDDSDQPGIGPERAMGWTVSPVLNGAGDLSIVYGNTAPVFIANNLLDNNLCLWNRITSTYFSCEIHVDMHYMRFEPNGQTLWVASDGGVYKSTMPDLINNWEEKNNGLAVSTIHQMAISDKNGCVALSGSYDNGSNIYVKSNDIWGERHVVAGDGFQCLIDWNDNSRMLASPQGSIYRSLNGSDNFNYLASGFHWHTFFEQNMIIPDILYGTNAQGVKSSNDFGNSWSNIANYPGVSDNKTWRVSVSPTDGNYIYASWYGNPSGSPQKVFKSFTGGGTNPGDWEDVGSPIENSWVSSIAVDFFNPDHIWVATNSFVYDVNTLTHEWSDISNGLPSYISIKHLEQLNGTEGELFAGTNYGLYYYNENDQIWQHIEGNLPNVTVSDIQIDLENNRIAVGTFGRGVWEAPLPCLTSSADMIIDSDETWSLDRRITKNIVIEAGNTLAINNTTIRLSDHAKITVKPGAKLTINGAKLTSVCSEPWQGIQVWGNTNANQLSDANGNYQQGYLELNNATIEKALCAVDLWKPGDYMKTGGILKATNSTFRNNTRSIHANHYKNIHPYNGTELSYFGRVKNCVFEITSAYIPDQTFYKHVDLADIKGFTFEGSDFSLAPNVAGVSDWNQAIAGYSAGFSVQATCTSPTLPCSTYDKCKFTGFRYGIFAKDAQFSVNTFTVDRAEFENNIYGINVHGIKNETILNSDFKVGYNTTSGCPAVSGYGIYLDNSTGFAIEENTFTKMLNAPVANYTGVQVNNSLGQDDIYKNSFTGLSFANYAHWQNWTTNAGIGLEYLCNTNQTNWADFYIPSPQVNENTIQTWQGNTLTSAGNTFSQSNNTWHFYTDGGIPLTYFYNGSSPLEPNDSKLWRVTKSASNAANQCPSHYGGNGSISSIVLNAQDQLLRENQYAYNLVNYNNVKTLHDQLRDGGSTQERISDIESAQPQDMWALRAELLGVSPHLSEEVLRKVADKTDVFTESVIFDILAANPDELKKEELLQYLENKDNPLPSYMIDILRQVAEGETYRTVLEKQMSMFRKEMTRAANDMIRSYLNDSVTDYNALRGWLDNLGGIEADKQIIATFIQEGNFQQASALANMLPTLYNLTGDALTEHERYMTMLDLYLTLQSENRHLDQLTTNEKALLEDYANNSSGSSGVAAKSILATYYNAQFVDCMQSIEPASLKKGAVSPEDMAKIYGMEISVKPNPTSLMAAFDYTLPDMDVAAILQITDMTGKIIETFMLTGKHGQKLWDTRPVNPGVYLYTLKSGIKSLTGKITIIK